jgi:hypothetical protein
MSAGTSCGHFSSVALVPCLQAGQSRLPSSVSITNMNAGQFFDEQLSSVSWILNVQGATLDFQSVPFHHGHAKNLNNKLQNYLVKTIYVNTTQNYTYLKQTRSK